MIKLTELPVENRGETRGKDKEESVDRTEQKTLHVHTWFSSSSFKHHKFDPHLINETLNVNFHIKSRFRIVFKVLNFIYRLKNHQRIFLKRFTT